MDGPAPHASRKQVLTLLGIAVGAVAGGIVGWLWPETGRSVQVLGDLFLVALRMLVVPLIVAAIICGVASLGDVRRLGRVAGYTFLYYALTTSLALLVGLVVVEAVDPGVGVDISGATDMPDRIHTAQELGISDLLLSLFTPNLIQAAANTEILPLITFSLAFGAVLTTVGDRGQLVLHFFEGINEAIMKLVQLIMWTAPFGVFGLVAGRLGQEGGGDAIVRVLQGLGLYAASVGIGLTIHALVTLPLILVLFTRRNPIRYLSGLGVPLMSAFATASSVAALPLTTVAVVKTNRVSADRARFVLPLGTTVNMDGTAMYEAVAAVFIAQAWGIELSFGQEIIIFLTATLASIGAAGIPEAGLVTMVIVLNAVGLPLEGIGLILSIDWFLDRCRTTVNVWGDAVGAAVVDALTARPTAAAPAP